MIDYTIIIGILALCFLWASWREYATENHRDSRLLLVLSLLTGLGSAGLAFST